jgi:hypothetical protein
MHSHLFSKIINGFVQNSKNEQLFDEADQNYQNEKNEEVEEIKTYAEQR